MTLNLVDMIILKNNSGKRQILKKICYANDCLNKCCDQKINCGLSPNDCKYYCDPRNCPMGCCDDDKCGEKGSCKDSNLRYIILCLIIGLVLFFGIAFRCYKKKINHYQI